MCKPIVVVALLSMILHCCTANDVISVNQQTCELVTTFGTYNVFDCEIYLDYA